MTFTYHQYHIIRITLAQAQAVFHPLSRIRIYLLVSNCDALEGVDVGYVMMLHMCRLPSKLVATLAMQH